MSGNLAIAAVSAVMKYLLQNPLPADSIAAVVPDLAVTAIPPHQVEDDTPHLNIFFYRAMSNIGWSTHNLPARSSVGARTANPYLALDLYYLVTAHSTRDYHGEILLGYAMQVFHENPVLPRDTIRDALSSGSLVTADTPASLLAAIAATDLAEQIEQIRLTPHYPQPEEASNTWSPLQTSYVPTAYYKASVVLIESRRPAQAAPPVRSFNLYALPFNQPRITDVIAETGAGQPILAGTRVLVRGAALRGDNTHVIIGGVDVSGNALEIAANQIAFTLPAALQAGIVGVQVAHLLNIGTPPAPHPGIESNVAALVLQPAIRRNGPNDEISVVAAGGGQPRRLTITLDPAVGAAQRVTVLLNERNAPANRAAHSFSLDADGRTGAPTHQITASIADVPAGTYLVRVRVDGAESPLDHDAVQGYIRPVVVVP